MIFKILNVFYLKYRIHTYMIMPCISITTWSQYGYYSGDFLYYWRVKKRRIFLYANDPLVAHLRHQRSPTELSFYHQSYFHIMLVGMMIKPLSKYKIRTVSKLHFLHIKGENKFQSVQKKKINKLMGSWSHCTKK